MEQKIDQILEQQATLLLEVVTLKESTEHIEERVTRIEEHSSEIIQTLDSFVTTVRNHESEITAHTDNYKRHDTRLDAIEKRLFA